MKKKITWIILTLVLVVIALVALNASGKFGGDKGTKVALEEVSKRTIIETVNASGKIFPEVEVKISSDVSGEITELNIQEGDSVQRGQVLARVFADLLSIQQQQASAVVSQQQFQVANSEAQLEGLKSAMMQAEAQYNRQKTLLENKVISRQEFEVAENTWQNAKASYNATLKAIEAGKAQVASARANLQRASTDVSRTTITSPMSGVVSLLNVKKGERVVGTAQMAGTEMMRIADMSRLEVRVDVTENDIPKVHLGDSALITVDAYLNRKFKGVVYQIASSNTGAAAAAAQTTNEVTNYKVYIRLLPESYADLIDPTKPRNFPFRPGMTASADIQTKVRSNVLSLPINAVTTRDKEEGSKKNKSPEKKEETEQAAGSEEDDKNVVVFAFDKTTSTVKQVVVKTGIQDTRFIEIVEGLQPGQQIVTEPYNVIFKVLKEGSKVQVVDKSKLFEVKK